MYCARAAVRAMSSSQTVLKQACLLGLPKELRLEIYQQVFALHLDCPVVNFWKHSQSQYNGAGRVPDLNSDARLVIPWISLMLSCKNIAIELRSIMSGKTFLDDDHNTTWFLELEARKGGRQLGQTTWQRLPCPPESTRILETSYNAKSGFRAWGDGGPHGIVSGLYQTLNIILHCGPRFDPKKQLQRPMHLRELRIKVESRVVFDRGEIESLADRETNPGTTLYALGSIVGQIVNTGVLRGYVDMISVYSAEKILSWTPREVKGEGKIPDAWAGYGFEWGIMLDEPAST